MRGVALPLLRYPSSAPVVAGKQALFTNAQINVNMQQVEVTALGEDDARKLIQAEMVTREGTTIPLSPDEENRVRTACGVNGSSPLAITVVCGVLRHILKDRQKPRWSLERREKYFDDLRSKVSGSANDFKELQDVMRVSFGYLPTPELKAAFLKLHLFPDHFSLAHAARVLGQDELRAEELLGELIDFRLLTWDQERFEYLILDHVWVFAARAAERDGGVADGQHADDTKIDLSRKELADATRRLIELALEDPQLAPIDQADIKTLPRLVRSALWRAKKCSSTELVVYEDEDPEYATVQLRSLGCGPLEENNSSMNPSNSRYSGAWRILYPAQIDEPLRNAAQRLRFARDPTLRFVRA